MYNHKRYRFAEHIMAFAASFVILFFVSSLSPQNIKSLSIIDLIVNNLVNIALAVIISFGAVQKYESNRQKVKFIIDLLKQTDALCYTMTSIAGDLCEDGNREKKAANVNMYCSYAKALTEYTWAIIQQAETSKKNRALGDVLAEMYHRAEVHLAVIGESVAVSGENTEKLAEAIQDDALQLLFEFQLSIPGVLASIKY